VWVPKTPQRASSVQPHRRLHFVANHSSNNRPECKHETPRHVQNPYLEQELEHARVNSLVSTPHHKIGWGLLFLFMVRPMSRSTLCPECGCVFVQERKLQAQSPKPKHLSSSPGPIPSALPSPSIEAQALTQPQTQAQALKLKPRANPNRTPKPKH
jgi:hypothetical protein